MSIELKIDPEFKELLAPLLPEELDQLHNELSARGCIDPLIVWKGKGVLVDGHNRYTYCKQHEIPFDVKEISFSSRDVVKNYIILHQLGRRNVDPDTASLLRGKLYNSQKKNVTNPEGGNQHKKEVGGHSDHQPKTRDRVAKETGVSAETIQRDAKFAKAVEKLGIEKDVMSGKDKRTRKQIIEAAGLGPKKARQVKPKPKKQPSRDDVLKALSGLTGKWGDEHRDFVISVIREQL